MSKVNLNVLIDEDLRKEFKAECAKQGVCMTEIINQYIIEFLTYEKIPSS